MAEVHPKKNTSAVRLILVGLLIGIVVWLWQGSREKEASQNELTKSVEKQGGFLPAPGMGAQESRRTLGVLKAPEGAEGTAPKENPWSKPRLNVREASPTGPASGFQMLFVHSSHIIGPGKPDEKNRAAFVAALQDYGRTLPGGLVFDADGLGLHRAPMLIYANPSLDVTDAVKLRYEALMEANLLGELVGPSDHNDKRLQP